MKIKGIEIHVLAETQFEDLTTQKLSERVQEALSSLSIDPIASRFEITGGSTYATEEEHAEAVARRMQESAFLNRGLGEGRSEQDDEAGETVAPPVVDDLQGVARHRSIVERFFRSWAEIEGRSDQYEEHDVSHLENILKGAGIMLVDRGSALTAALALADHGLDSQTIWGGRS